MQHQGLLALSKTMLHTWRAAPKPSGTMQNPAEPCNPKIFSALKTDAETMLKPRRTMRRQRFSSALGNNAETMQKPAEPCNRKIFSALKTNAETMLKPCRTMWHQRFSSALGSDAETMQSHAELGRALQPQNFQRSEERCGNHAETMPNHAAPKTCQRLRKPY